MHNIGHFGFAAESTRVAWRNRETAEYRPFAVHVNVNTGDGCACCKTRKLDLVTPCGKTLA